MVCCYLIWFQWFVLTTFHLHTTPGRHANFTTDVSLSMGKFIKNKNLGSNPRPDAVPAFLQDFSNEFIRSLVLEDITLIN